MPTLLTFKQAARRIGLHSARVLSDAFYDDVLGDEHCQYVGSRRAIPDSYLDKIAATLRRAGRFREAQVK